MESVAAPMPQTIRAIQNERTGGSGMLASA
jgi:hypothetical protein